MMPVARTAVHVHSNWSYDGTWPIERLVSALARRRYDAVLMAEHDLGFDQSRWSRYLDACARANRGGFIVVPGIEYSDSENLVHIAVWGTSEFLGEGLETLELLTRARAAGGIAVLAHPGRRGAWKHLDPKCFPLLFGVEVWNRKYDGWAPSAVTHEVLQLGDDLAQFVGLDFHTARQFFPLSVHIDCEGRISEGAIVEALKNRRCTSQILGLTAKRVQSGAPLRFARRAERFRRGLGRTARGAKRLAIRHPS